MGVHHMTFNLLEEPWIPVLWTDGKFERVSINTALTAAGRIRQIAAGNPMDRVAILRFLLALLYWCQGNPPERADAKAGDSFPPDWFAKLDENKECFNLLGEGKRFYQDRHAHGVQAVTELLQEIPKGNNFWHFRHSTDKVDGICPACCAIGMLRLPLFSVSGLPELKAGINGTPPVYVVPWGLSLLETLLMNWTPTHEIGTPAWIQPDIRPTPGQDVSILTGLTLLSRRVWLHEPSGPPACCICCGQDLTALIRTCEYQTAGELKNDRWTDPHVVYLEGPKRDAAKAPDLTASGKFKMDRPWPTLLSRIAKMKQFHGKTVLIIGFATHQAKNIDVWERIVTIPSQVSAQASENLEQWQKEGWRQEKQVERIRRSKVISAAAVTTLRPHVENTVSANAGDLLVDTEAAWDEAVADYGPMMEVIATSLAPGFTTAAVQRRAAIAGVKPEMRAKGKPAGGTRRKQGDGK